MADEELTLYWDSPVVACSEGEDLPTSVFRPDILHFLFDSYVRIDEGASVFGAPPQTNGSGVASDSDDPDNDAGSDHP